MWLRKSEPKKILQQLTGKFYDADSKNKWLNFKVRKTVEDDIPYLNAMMEHSEFSNFVKPNLYYFMEMANLMYSLIGVDNEIYGQATFMDFPETYPKDIDETSWIQWLNEKVKNYSFKFINSIFLYYYVFVHSVVFVEYMRGILEYLFEKEHQVNYCFLYLPKNFKQEGLETIFKPLVEINDDKMLYVAFRQNFEVLLHVRDGRIDDNDDLLPLLNKSNPLIAENYGEFYFVEMLNMVDEKTRILVGEVNEFAVGFMIISADIDVQVLNKHFDLEPYHGFLKKISDDTDETEKLEIITYEFGSPENKEFVSKEIDNTKVHFDEENKTLGQTDVMFKKESKPSTSFSLKEEIYPESSKLEKISKTNHSKEKLEIKSLLLNKKSLMEKKENDEFQMSENLKPRLPSVNLSKRFILYSKKTNAFCIHFYCIEEEYKKRSVEFLYIAFEKFENLEYCIITVPHVMNEMPLLKYFVRLAPKPNSLFPHTLYICHKGSLFSYFHVRYAVPTDLPHINAFINTLNGNKNIMNDINQYFEAGCDERRIRLHALVALNINQIVGIIILRNKDELDTMNMHYCLENLINFEYHKNNNYGIIIGCLLIPTFNCFARAFLKETLRITKKMTLHYAIYPIHSTIRMIKNDPFMPLLSEFLPVKPIENSNYSEEESEVEEIPFALYHFSRKLSMKFKKNINHRIVIIGASEVALGILETLIFNTEMTFNNLTVISTHGLPGSIASDFHQKMALSQTMNYPQVMLDKLGFHSWTSVVYGTVTGIDRKEKHITIESYGKYAYDLLILCCGIQYINPTKSTDFEFMEKHIRTLKTEKLPSNMFIINDEFDAANFIYYVKNILEDSKDKIIIYGNTIDTYCCIATLLTLGISGSKIYLVKPVAETENKQVKYIIENKDINETINRHLLKNHVHISEDWTLKRWKVNEQKNVITHINFKDTENNKHHIKCNLFVANAKSAIDLPTFKTISDSGLTFDGALVINAKFQTSDPCIFAGGTITKPRKCYAIKNWNRNNYNSKELGQKLGDVIIQTVTSDKEDKKEKLDYWPDFKMPIIIYAELPCGWHYLHIRKPESPYFESKQETRYIMETGCLAEDKDYFRIELDRFNTIETIICLSRQNLDIINLIRLHGLHQSMLNNVLLRYKEGNVEDFFSYFRQSWICALYHSAFPRFRDDIRKLLYTFDSPRKQSFMEEISRMLEEKENITDEEKQSLHRILDQRYKSEVEKLLLKFLTDHNLSLPMYYVPKKKEKKVN